MKEPDRGTDVIESGLDQRLTLEEDSELRRLNYLAKMGHLSERSEERLIELRLHDRREEIREPKEFGDDQPARKPRRRLPFIGR